MQRGLPRPVSLDHAPEPRAGGGAADRREAAEGLLFNEMRALLQNDAAKYPLRESKKDKKVVSALRIIVVKFYH
jgi:pre-mRNA-splicing factor CDC5/CEF1